MFDEYSKGQSVAIYNMKDISIIYPGFNGFNICSGDSNSINFDIG